MAEGWHGGTFTDINGGNYDGTVSGGPEMTRRAVLTMHCTVIGGERKRLISGIKESMVQTMDEQFDIGKSRRIPDKRRWSHIFKRSG